MRRNLFHLLLPILILAFPHLVSAADQRIAAIVNDGVVSVRDLNERLGLVLLTSRIPDQEQARNRLAKQVLRGLIEEQLQLQEANRLSITVEPDELGRALQDIAGRNQLSVEQLQQLLETNNIDPGTLQNQLRAQIAWLKVVNQRIRPQVNVTVDQLEIAVEEAQRNQGQPEYLLSEIVLPVDNPSQEQRVAADAARLVQTLSEGASFEALARQVSASATASRGGDLGWVPASTIPGELVGALGAPSPRRRLAAAALAGRLFHFSTARSKARRRRQPEKTARRHSRWKLACPRSCSRLISRNDQELSSKVDEAAALRDRLNRLRRR